MPVLGLCLHFMRKGIPAFLLIITGLLFLATQQAGLSGCAQISAPTGGPKDSLPPSLVSASPSLKSINVTSNKITLTFDEYVEIKDAQANVIISPQPKNVPLIDYKLKTVTVKLKDTLRPNTTYAINFGNAIADINEGNVFRDFTYVFSTGKTIDSLTFSGTVTLAETGKVDSTLMVMLYRNAPDSAVTTRRPDYISRLDGSGKFTFSNLPEDRFKVYALKDGDGGKTYNSKSELFAFLDSPITVTVKTADVTLMAFAEQKDKATNTKAAAPEKKLKYNMTLTGETQDLLSDLSLLFNNPLKTFDSNAVQLTDTNFVVIPGSRIRVDSTGRSVIVTSAWAEGTSYRILINKNALADSAGNQLSKSDTLRFITKKESDYGSLILRFKNLDMAKHPVLQFVQNDNIVNTYPLTGDEWRQKLFRTGEYELRILFDTNRNGKWDPGDYTEKRQPEKVTPLPQKIAIRANWDNERDITL